MNLEYEPTTCSSRDTNASEQLWDRELPVSSADDPRRRVGNCVENGIAASKRCFHPLPVIDRRINIEPCWLALIGHRPRADQHPERPPNAGLAACLELVDLAGRAERLQEGSAIRGVERPEDVPGITRSLVRQPGWPLGVGIGVEN